VLREVYIPWAVRAAPRARPLMNVWYERELDTPLSELRARLNITPAPQRGEGKGNKA
jgi:ubiquinone biosynthesis protein COQ4